MESGRPLVRWGCPGASPINCLLDGRSIIWPSGVLPPTVWLVTGAQAGAKKKRIANGSDFAGMKSALDKSIGCRGDEGAMKGNRAGQRLEAQKHFTRT